MPQPVLDYASHKFARLCGHSYGCAFFQSPGFPGQLMFAMGLQHVAIITWYHKYFTSKFIHVTKSYDFKTEVDHREAISQMTTRQSPTHLWLVQIAAAQWKPRSWRRFLLPMTFGIQVCQSCDLDYWCFPSWAPDRLKWSPNRWHYEQVTEVIAYYSPYKWSLTLLIIW